MILLIFVVFFHISCEKDSDLLLEAILEDPITTEDSSSENDPNFETKSFTFQTVEDAYLQGSKGINESIMRLEENNRVSFLMFDLSPINEVNGEIIDVDLQFTIHSDQGNGTIDIYKGIGTSWKEEDLNQEVAPKYDVLLASVSKSFELETTEIIKLNNKEVKSEKTSLVLTHRQGNDFAIASKENSSKKGPKLVVTYMAPLGSKDIEVTYAEETLPEEPQENPLDEEKLNLNSDVAYWKDKFDAKWTTDKIDALTKSKSGNHFQEYYYLGYYIDGLTSIWRATGDNTYLNEALQLIENTMQDAKPMSGTNTGYLGWPSDLSKYGSTRYQEGTSLWEAFMFRHVATLLRIMYESPNLRSSGYQSRYDAILNFTEKHIFEKWADYDGGIYRSRTHMASHWARIGMELYIITGNQKYNEVFENISFGTMPNRSSNLRNQIHYNPNVPTAYIWSSEWGKNYDSGTQDTSHAGAIISFWVTAYENNMYWNKNDIDALISTLDQVVWKDSDGVNFYKIIDGSGSYDYSGRLNEWLPLGRYSVKIQNKIKDKYIGSNLKFYGSQTLGIASLNSKFLTDGSAVYPEN
ncbi:hypothetical protein [Sediminicola sp. YIK13]|uniref:hypothetical protein n=1 Tax=Sediminicola sp. YIK13 TaxID=1453352 RepID=UPI0011A42DE9|nr:hypothetical protein [Sediminicola sp. YIK13]